MHADYSSYWPVASLCSGMSCMDKKFYTRGDYVWNTLGNCTPAYIHMSHRGGL